MPWACMTKDDEVSSIAFTDLFGPRRSGCELEGGEGTGVWEEDPAGERGKTKTQTNAEKGWRPNEVEKVI